jgi:phytanoyl-CoA hydroxylase
VNTGSPSEFARRGYTIARGLVDAATIEEYRSHLHVMQGSERSIFAADLTRDAFLAAVSTDHRLTGLAAQLLGSPVVSFGAAYMVKKAMVGPEALWHQDGHPWEERLGITEAVTLWIALDDVDETNGALRVIRGTHTRPAQPLVTPERPQDGGYFGAGMDPGAIEPADVDLLVLAAGDVSAHHPCLIHGSGPNTSDRDRRALVLRYRPASPGSDAQKMVDAALAKSTANDETPAATVNTTVMTSTRAEPDGT